MFYYTFKASCVFLILIIIYNVAELWLHVPLFTSHIHVVIIPQAPSNLVTYRDRVGQIFQFTLTGTPTGSVWGTDIYTDDSALACAAVHAGVVLAGETKEVTVKIVAGQSSYQGSVRNGVTSSSYGTWPGSYSFVGKYMYI